MIISRRCRCAGEGERIMKREQAQIIEILRNPGDYPLEAVKDAISSVLVLTRGGAVAFRDGVEDLILEARAS
jgi:hypothetical protein